MKRSRINEIMAEADAMMRHHGWTLPPFRLLDSARIRRQKRHRTQCD